MRVVILQPGYLPWLGFFDQFYQSDLFVIYDDVQFDRRGWRHRNRIKSATGIQWLTVPVLKKGNYIQMIKETKIADETNWQRKQLGAIRTNYVRASYFDLYFPELERTLQRPWSFLIDLDLALMELILGWLGLQRETRLSSQMNVDGGQTRRLFEICNTLGATEYLTGDAAKDYIDESLFVENGIRLRYHNFNHPIYTQLFGEFVPYLSIVDLLFNEGPKSLEILTNQTGESVQIKHSESQLTS